jgi:hypothetical protein
VDQGLRERQARLAHNQSLFREVNERIEEINERLEETSGTMVFACECAATDCMESVSLTADEYEAVRRFPNHFFVKPGHVYAEVERIADHVGADGTRYEVVEKFGEGGKVAVELDQRRASSG